MSEESVFANDGGVFPEEDWEVQVASMLRRLPPVEPPRGFIEGAIDRRPLHAGRGALGAVSLTAVAVVGSITLGFVGPGRVAPSLDSLAALHSEVSAARLAGSSSTLQLDAILSADSNISIDDRAVHTLDLPPDFEHRADLLADNLRQAVYAHGDEMVSVFTQPGHADFDRLGSSQVREFDGIPAWVDEEDRIMVIDTSDSVVTIVGLGIDEMAAVIADTRPHPESVWVGAVKDLASQVGLGG